MFDIGQNDLAGAFYSKTEDQILASIPTILSEFESGLKVPFIFYSHLELLFLSLFFFFYKTIFDIEIVCFRILYFKLYDKYEI